MKNNSNSKIILLVLICISFFMNGCKDLIEKDITNKQITVISPYNGAASAVYKQLFWWNKLDGATQYSIQIVSPSFDSIKAIYTDTIVIGLDKFTKTLVPGSYQWRIRGENGAYKSNYTTQFLTIQLSSLDNQTVSLLAPANNSYVGTSSNGVVNFSWEKITGATKYLIEIDTISGNFGSTIIKSDSITSTTFTYTFAASGDFKWRVKAKDNAGIETDWSSVYSTGYFNTTPATPKPTSPANNFSATSSTVSFSWSPVSNAQIYTLSIYSISQDSTKESTTKFTVSAPTATKTITVPISFSSGQDLYWRVSATDKANNKSGLSLPRTVIVN